MNRSTRINSTYPTAGRASNSHYYHEELGIILLGNTGVGKSCLANILLDREVFEHKCSTSSVTHETEFELFVTDECSYAIYNIPGLIEVNQNAVDKNKQEIYKAFQQRPKSIIVFVFNGGSGGRLRDEDFVAFNAIHKAYNFQEKSLVVAINDLPPPGRRDSDYEAKAIVQLQHLLAMPNLKVCFLDRIDIRDRDQREQLRMQLVDAVIDQCEATEHRKLRDIELRTDEIEKLKSKSKEEQEKFQREIAQLKDEINQKAIEVKADKERMQQEFADLKREMEEERRLAEQSRIAHGAEQQRLLHLIAQLQTQPKTKKKKRWWKKI